jgi:hypothetical protein
VVNSKSKLKLLARDLRKLSGSQPRFRSTRVGLIAVERALVSVRFYRMRGTHSRGHGLRFRLANVMVRFEMHYLIGRGSCSTLNTSLGCMEEPTLNPEVGPECWYVANVAIPTPLNVTIVSSTYRVDLHLHNRINKSVSPTARQYHFHVA